MLVTFSGQDCSGKSTQLDRAADWLESEGYRVARLWYRPGYSARLDNLRAFVRRARPGSLPRTARDGGDDQARAQVFGRPGVAQAWLTMALADSVLEYGARLRWLLRNHDVVLVDRYLDDAWMDLELRFPSRFRRVGLRALGLRWSAPKPDLKVLLTVSPDVQAERMAMKNEPFPDPEPLRLARFRAYERLAISPGYVVVDADRDIDAVAADIRAAVSALRSGGRRASR